MYRDGDTSLSFGVHIPWYVVRVSYIHMVALYLTELQGRRGCHPLRAGRRYVAQPVRARRARLRFPPEVLGAQSTQSCI